MDPQIATDGTSFEVLAAVIEGLYSVDEAGSPIKALADKVEKSEDGLHYTIILKDAKWTNGAPVTANDFVFAWKRLVDPAVASEYAFIVGIAGIKNADKIAATEEIFSNPVHPYTKSLISAIPHPNPIVEKNRISEEYCYKTSGIKYEDGKEQHVGGTHYVFATDDEFEKWSSNH